MPHVRDDLQIAVGLEIHVECVHRSLQAAKSPWVGSPGARWSVYIDRESRLARSERLEPGSRRLTQPTPACSMQRPYGHRYLQSDKSADATSEGPSRILARYSVSRFTYRVQSTLTTNSGTS